MTGASGEGDSEQYVNGRSGRCELPILGLSIFLSTLPVQMELNSHLGLRSPDLQMGHNGEVLENHYHVIGVPNDASFDVIRRAYRAKMRALHPDATGSAADSQVIARLSGAWRVLSDPERRQTYDAELVGVSTSGRSTMPWRVAQQPAPQAARSRREAWVFGVRAQIIHLSSRAGKSATQTLLLRSPRAVRAEYDELVTELVGRIASDTEARVRAARAAGAAPLDLGVGATLIGIRAVADQLRRSVADRSTVIDLMEAELLDRMWDVLAHELPVGLTAELGGNPGVSKLLRQAG